MYFRDSLSAKYPVHNTPNQAPSSRIATSHPFVPESVTALPMRSSKFFILHYCQTGVVPSTTACSLQNTREDTLRQLHVRTSSPYKEHNRTHLVVSFRRKPLRSAQAPNWKHSRSLTIQSEIGDEGEYSPRCFEQKTLTIHPAKQTRQSGRLGHCGQDQPTAPSACGTGQLPSIVSTHPTRLALQIPSTSRAYGGDTSGHGVLVRGEREVMSTRSPSVRHGELYGIRSPITRSTG